MGHHWGTNAMGHTCGNRTPHGVAHCVVAAEPEDERVACSVSPVGNTQQHSSSAGQPTEPNAPNARRCPQTHDSRYNTPTETATISGMNRQPRQRTPATTQTRTVRTPAHTVQRKAGDGIGTGSDNGYNNNVDRGVFGTAAGNLNGQSHLACDLFAPRPETHRFQSPRVRVARRTCYQIKNHRA